MIEALERNKDWQEWARLFSSAVPAKVSTPDAKTIATIVEINRKIFSLLKKNASAAQKMKAFALARKWPEGFAEKLGVVYYDADAIQLEKWARENGYTPEQMVQSGWFNKRDSKPYLEASIKIPYYADEKQTQIVIWKSRIINPRPNLPKYLTSQAATLPLVNSNLYNAWELGLVKGKTLVMTEGEFKAAVATSMTKVLHIGIPGITSIGDDMIQTIVHAEAEEIIIVLDRDPKSSGLMRLDEISDSQRAAYTIARRLQKAGQKKVRIGLLPDIFEGDKVGADDLLVSKGVALYQKTLSSALSPEEYAASLGFDPVFQDLHYQLQEVKRPFFSYHKAIEFNLPVVRQLTEEEVKKGSDVLTDLQNTYNRYIHDILLTDRRIDQPSYRYEIIPEPPSTAPAFANITEFSASGPGHVFTSKDFGSNIILVAGKELNLSYSFPASEFAISHQVKLSMLKSGKTISATLPTVVYKKETGKVYAIADPTASDDQKLAERWMSVLRP